MSVYEDNQRENALKSVSENFSEFIEDLKDSGKLSELEGYIPNYKIAMEQRWTAEKAKTVFKLLESDDEEEISDIHSYLNQTRCGWNKDTYVFYNRCRDLGMKCRKNYFIENSPKVTKDVFGDIAFLFLHKEYGSITTYIFSYCLASLFSSKLHQKNRSIPYFLQVACESNSNTYKLIHKIVHICDVSTGISSACVPIEEKYRDCGYDHTTIFPSGKAENQLENIIEYHDIPIIVDGYEDNKLYKALLRETANIPGKKKMLGKKYKFHVLPIFMCSSIESQFRNIFSINLTDLDIDDEYMDVLKENEQRLASWAFELVSEAKSYFVSSDNTDGEKIIASRNGPNFFYDIDTHVDILRRDHREYINLEKKDISNVGYLMYFFSKFMSVFEGSLRFNSEVEFEYDGVLKNYSKKELIENIISKATISLFELHNGFSPIMQHSWNINVQSLGNRDLKKIISKGKKYAKDIINYYQKYRVQINILPDIEYKNDQYIFDVKLIAGTNGRLIGAYADEVRRLLDIPSFTPQISNSSIKIIASENFIKENSLLKILQSQQFQESKMEIPYAVGYDMYGEMIISDIAEFPHLLIGGTTGSGKSSALHSLLMSIVYKQPADKVKLLLLDFGASRLNMFENTPHMLLPGKTIRNAKEGRQCILKLQEEVERRLSILDSKKGKDYDNEREKWCSIVCVIDEFPAFIQQLEERKENRKSSTMIEDLLARARKIKIHLILSAQDATQKSIEISNTNLAASIAFQCTSWRQSQAIIGESDAVNLSSKGALYFKCSQHEGLKRLQGSYMPPEKIMDMLDKMDFITHSNNIKYEDVRYDLSTPNLSLELSNNDKKEDEEKLIKIINHALEKGKISNKDIKGYGMGYDKANTYLKKMEDYGIIQKQREGDKLARKVNQDKANEFLEKHGHNSNTVSEMALDETSTFSLAQVDTEINQEGGKKDVIEEKISQTNKEETVIFPDAKELQQAIIQALPHMKSPKKWRNPKRKNDNQKL